MAYLAAENSRDPRTRIGSVLVKGNSVVATSFNGFPIGVKDLPERYNDRETKYGFINHSEQNSILLCARNGISTLNTKLYSFGIPCEMCSKCLIQGGVSEIVCHKQWPNLTYSEKWVKSVEISKIMLDEAGIEIRWLDKVLGVEGVLDGKVIKV